MFPSNSCQHKIMLWKCAILVPVEPVTAPKTLFSPSESYYEGWAPT